MNHHQVVFLGLLGWHIFLASLFTIYQFYLFSSNRIESNLIGYWNLDDGKITANLDWCELNYIYSYYIAEFYNSFTSLSFSFFGIIAIYYHFDLIKKEGMFFYSYIALIFVGIGSFYFHCALTYESELCDELPMVWVVLLMFYNILDNPYPKLHIHLICWSTFVTIFVIICVFIQRHGILENIARGIASSTFCFALTYSLYKCYIIQYQYNTISELSKLFKLGIMIFCFAELCWVLDIVACSIIQNCCGEIINLQFHAFGWHVLLSYAIYILNMEILYFRYCCKLGKRNQYQLVWKYSFLPIIRPL